MYKKLVFALLLFVPAAALASFPDIYASNPYTQAIDYVQNKGIVGGYPNGLFMPDSPINRAEFVKILVKTNYPQSEISACTQSSFSDVPKSEWFAPYVCLAKKKGVIDGYPDKTFKPVNDISFAEAAKILRNTMLPNDALVNDSKFTHWYEPYVNVLSAHHDIPFSINGFDANITRGEMAEMIYRLDAKLDVLPSLSIWEMGDRAVIESYYAAISGADLEKAYNMKIDPGMTLDAFKAMYTDFPFETLLNFRKTAASTYEFTILTFPNVSGTAKGQSERYDVTMQVVEGKLKTISSVKQTTGALEEITNGTENASIEWDNGVYKIYVVKNGQQTLAAQLDTHDGLAPIIKNIKFSNAGKYLTYQLYDWESAILKIYDITQQKELDNIFMGPEFFGFTANDDHFYFCSQSGMSSGEVTVVALPEAVQLLHLTGFDNTAISGCGPFDSSTNTLNYQLQKADGSVTDLQYAIK